MNENNNKITSLDDLRNYAQGQVVELPPFADGMPLVARLKRPSMLAMMKTGKIPNTLMKTANSLFEGSTSRVSNDNPETYKEVFDVMEIIVDSTLVKPTHQQIKDAGLELTDDQLMMIFNYTQQGVQALKSFRQFETDNTDSKLSERLPSEAERDSKD